MIANLVNKVLYHSGQCHLCGLDIMADEGVDQEPDWYRHRLCCILKKYSIYKKLKCTPVPCVLCSKPLRLWDIHEELSFSCQKEGCPSYDKPIENTGYNRYCCFECDYDLCFTCYSQEVPKKEDGTTQESDEESESAHASGK